MKTSYSRAWGMRVFHTCNSEISTYREYGDYIIDPYIINQIFCINHPQQGARITPESAPSIVSVGKWRRRNERMGRYMRMRM